MKKGGKMQNQMQETVGIDLGDKMSRYCVVNRAGEVVEEGSFRNPVSSIEAHFGGSPRRIALEAGAIGLDQPRAEAAGTRSDRGQSTRAEVDHLERHQERSCRCAQTGPAVAGRRAAVGDLTPQLGPLLSRELPSPTPPSRLSFALVSGSAGRPLRGSRPSASEPAGLP